MISFLGVKILEDCHVKEILTEKQRAGQYDRVTSAVTSQGNIKCDVFINCTGMVGRFHSQEEKIRKKQRILFFVLSVGTRTRISILSRSVRIPTQACGKCFCQLAKIRIDYRRILVFRIYLFENKTDSPICRKHMYRLFIILKNAFIFNH